MAKIKDQHIDFFLRRIETGELVFRNGVLVRPLKDPKRAGRNFKRVGKITSKGYVQLSGKKDGKEVFALEHRVIWAFYYGRENLDPELQINHKNGIKNDNRVENLELVTPSANMKHAYLTGLNIPRIGEENPDSRLTERQVLMIKVLLNSGGFEDSELAYQFGVTPTNIGHIKRGKIWTHIKPDSIARRDTE